MFERHMSFPVGFVVEIFPTNVAAERRRRVGTRH